MKKFLFIIWITGGFTFATGERANELDRPFYVAGEIYATPSPPPKQERPIAVKVGDTINVSYEGWWRIDSVHLYKHP